MNAQTLRGELLEALLPIVHSAGAVILEIYGAGFEVRIKSDRSPVTAADAEAEAVILPRLRALTPDIPVVSEESAETGSTPQLGKYFWLVDPLDGTREFIQRNGEFTVNIALIEAGEPVVGVVFAPALDRLFAGADGVGAFRVDGDMRRPIAVRKPPAEGLTVLASRSHCDEQADAAYVAGLPIAEHKKAGSSLKFGILAAGEADLYPRFGPTMEWDTAAGHAILAAAGGNVATLDGGRLRYGKPAFLNPHFVAVGRSSTPPDTP